MSALRAKTLARALAQGSLGSPSERGATASSVVEARQVGVGRVIDRAGEPRPGEAILSIGSTTADQFHARLAAWLADVAMNGQGTT